MPAHPTSLSYILRFLLLISLITFCSPYVPYLWLPVCFVVALHFSPENIPWTITLLPALSLPPNPFNWLGLCVLLTLLYVRSNHSFKNRNKRNNMLYWIRIPYHCYWKYFWSVPVALSLLPAYYCSFEIDLFSLAAVLWRFTGFTVLSNCRFLFYLCCLV